VLLGALGLLLMSSASAASAPTASASRMKQVNVNFQFRVCRGFARMNDVAAPYLERFNHYYYEAEPTPENLRAAGRAGEHLYRIYAAFNKRWRDHRQPPADQRGLWRRYWHQEFEVLKYGFKAMHVLRHAADKPRAEHYFRREIVWEKLRNATWKRMGLHCY
jgi:hypothetical protein